MTNALLFSNSANHGKKTFEHASEVIADYFAGVPEILFVPWALADHDAYTEQVSAAYAHYGIKVRGLHKSGDVTAAIADAAALFVGGGNTFRLLSALYRNDLIEPIRAAVASGLLYSGASAGSLIASPTMRTTNDMPIVQPPSLDTLGLLPFQLNCHYIDADPTSTHAGETRELRIAEFHEENDVAVLGLREGTWLRLDDRSGTQTAVLGGRAVDSRAAGPGIIHLRNTPAREVAGDVSELLTAVSRFDSPAR